MFIFFYLIFDQGGAYFWRLAYILFIILAVLDLVIELVFAWEIDSVVYKIKHSGRELAIKMVSRYLDQHSALETVEEFEEVISMPFNIVTIELTGPKKLSTW